MPFPSLETIAVLMFWLFVQPHNFRKKSPSNRDSAVVAAAFIFLFAGFASASYAYDAAIAYKILLTGGVCPILCLFIARRHLRTKDDVRLVILGFFGLVIQVAIFTALAWSQRQTIAPQNDNLVIWLYRGANPVIVFGSPSATITAIVASIPLVAWYRIYGRWNNNLIWAIVTISTIIVGAMSLSRGSWLGLLVALTTSLPLYFKRIQMRAIILITLILLVVYFSGYYDLFLQFFDSRLSSQINTVDIRLANYQLALESSTNHFFSGLGLGNYRYIYSEFPSASASKMPPLWFAHSLFLTLIPEIGLIGAIAFAYIFVSRLVKGIISYQTLASDEDRWFKFALLAATFSYIVVVSTSGGHLVATLSDYLVAPALIVAAIVLGCLSSDIKDPLPADAISNPGPLQRMASR
jgi:O-antigen ligase